VGTRLNMEALNVPPTNEQQFYIDNFTLTQGINSGVFSPSGIRQHFPPTYERFTIPSVIQPHQQISMQPNMVFNFAPGCTINCSSTPTMGVTIKKPNTLDEYIAENMSGGNNALARPATAAINAVVNSGIATGLIVLANENVQTKRYACVECNKRFQRSGDLSRHVKTHDGVKPFVCNFEVLVLPCCIYMF